MARVGLDPWQVVRNAVAADMERSGMKPLMRVAAGAKRGQRVYVTADGTRPMQRGVRPI